MHGDRPIRALAHVQKASGDDVAGRAAVHEKQVVVIEPGVRETFGVVDLLVETDNGGDVVFAEIREVSLGRVEGITVFYFTFWMWTAECKKFARDDPI